MLSSSIVEDGEGILIAIRDCGEVCDDVMTRLKLPI
jgi:hypothetical protein